MKKQHILVVEDDAEMREALSDILSEEGYEVKTTGKGKEALAIAIEEKEKFPIAICLIDLKLPDISGIKVLRGLKELNPESYAIVMTAFASKDTAIEALKAGAYSYVEKPINMEELLHVIKKATESYQLQEEKKQAEDKIRELAEIHTDLRERAPVAIVNVYEDYSINCTDKLLEWTGWSREEIEHINLVKESRFINASGNEVVLPPLVAAEMIEKTEKEYIPKLMRGETLEGVYQCYNKKDGGTVPLELNSIGYFGGKEPKPENFEYTICIFSNITERKKAEEKLKIFSHSADSSLDAVAMGNLKGMITYVNDAFVRMFGYSREELIGKEVPFIYPEDQIPKLKEALKATLEGSWSGELAGKRKNGELFPMAISASRAVDDEGNILAYLASHRDITERKRAEDILRESKEKYRNLFENAGDLIMTLDLEGRFTLVNKAAENVAGCDRKEIIGKLFTEFVPSKYHPLLLEAFGKAVKGIPTPLMEIEVKEKNGELIPLEILPGSIPIKEKGQLIGVQITAIDIKERKEAEQALRKSEAKYMDLYENATDMISTFDLRGRFTSANQAACTIFGYRKDEVSKLALSDLLLPEDAKLAWERLQKMVALKSDLIEEQPWEYKAVRKDGSIFDVEVMTRLILENGKIVGSQGISRDITERKRAEEELKNAEEQYRVTFEHIGTAMAILEEDTTISLCNKEVEELSGYSKAEIEGKKSWIEFVHSDDLEKMRRYHEERRKEGGKAPPNYEFRAVDCKGNVKDIYLSIEMIPGTKKSVISLIDITERKRAEEELKKSREFLETVIENIPDTITLRDSEQRFVLVNQAYCNIIGLTKHEVIGKKGEHKETNDKVFQTGRMVESPELTYTDADGVRHYVHSKKVPLADESGKITHVLTISRDITERKNAEEKIRQAEKEWRDSFSSLADVMIVVDTNFTIERVNKAAEELVGEPKDEIIGRKCYKVFHNIDNPPRNCPLKKSLNTKKVETVERYEQKFGRYFSVKSSPVLDKNGEITKFVDLMSDISERKRAEKEVKKYTKELERVNRDLEDFTSTVSHDLRAPLRSIQAFSMLLTEDYADVLDETGRGYLNRVKEAVERMSVQIEDLLTLSRVGRKFIDVETVDLNELLEEIKADLSARIWERGGEVVVGKLPSVFTQRVWMKELFTNLIDNGLKFNKSGKPRAEISCEENGKNYLFKVKDNGIGIEEKHLDKIFSLFERLHSQSEYEGTGAGLAICMKIVEGLGGDIWVKSKLGEGSTFCFTIPRN